MIISLLAKISILKEKVNMTHEEMSNFTWGELSSMPHSDLELAPTELLKKIVEEYNANDIPKSVLIKLQKICFSLSESCIENNLEIPTHIKSVATKKKLTKLEMIAVVADILGIIGFLFNAMQPKSTQQQIHTHNHYHTIYIMNEYNNDVNCIIEELEQTHNVTVNIDDYIPESSTK